MRWIGVMNLLLLGILFFLGVFLLFPSHEEEISLPFCFKPDQKELPKSPFSSSEEFFQDIGDNLFSLNWIPPQMQLPDLRQELLFCGKNARPDALQGRSSFHFSLKSSQDRMLIREGERIYLVYQGIYAPKLTKELYHNQEPQSPYPLWGDITMKSDAAEKNVYVFSPGNQPTPLWFEVRNGNEQTADVLVSMLDEKGALVTAPPHLRAYQLHLQDLPKMQSMGWELGKHRVDPTLLVRQKARWIGPDIFLERHGGEEFSYTFGKERLDFLEDPQPYSCFVQGGDFLVWRENRWAVAYPDEETHHLPLMVIKKIDEKIMSFDLWDPDGRVKTHLSLIRSKDHIGMPNLTQEFKFVGAKTWAQFIVECRAGERMTLKPHDWLVLTTDAGWIKLDTPCKIDAFVEQSIIGPLFVLEKMSKKNGRQVLIGHLFNTSRTEIEQIELISSPPSPLSNLYRRIPIVPPIQTNRLETKETEGK